MCCNKVYVVHTVEVEEMQMLVLCLAYVSSERCILATVEQRGLSLLLVSNYLEPWRILRVYVRLAVRVHEALLILRMAWLAVL